jgi:hypothetical protein
LRGRLSVSISTVNLIEGAHGLPSTSREQIAAIQTALEANGIEFFDSDAPGLRETKLCQQAQHRFHHCGGSPEIASWAPR